MERAAVDACLTRFRHLYREAFLFGSVARGTQDRHSDVDLVLIRDTDLPFFDRIREVFDLVHALGPLDLLIYTEAERRQMLAEPGRYFIKDVFEKGIRFEGTQGRSPSVAAAG
jgi:uncharacterized protein